jgi:starch synthase (maltosyl-transferring)
VDERLPVEHIDPVAAERTSGRVAQRPARVVIEGVEPDVERGRYAVKRIVGDRVDVGATIFTEGHDHLAASLCVRPRGTTQWRRMPMASKSNDRWEADFVPDAVGAWELTIEAWVDRFRSWLWGLERKLEARQDVSSELADGAALVAAAAERARGEDRTWLAARAADLARENATADRGRLALDLELSARMARHPDRDGAAVLDYVVRLEVERERAAFGAWYECVPRSCAPEPGRHGTLQDLIARLPYIAGMGFDVLYLPPIHPIGETHRKGRNNSLAAAPGDPGSPWAIGSRAGGHMAVHPELGSLADFDALVAAARGAGLEIALDLAFQCSQDHPYVTAHPEWFRKRPDGSIRYAENPPKRYEDIVPFDFECASWRELWAELREVVLFWVGRGIVIFRVDNPHTKPFSFWEGLIAGVRRAHPEVIFLSEAFTRPAVMRRLAKIGFSQSYTYFTWRNTKADLTAYLTELTQGPARDYMRGNLFANTPDILHEYLQTGGRPAFQSRLVLAATLAGSYGVYGPPFELCVETAVPGTEEYLDSEKYQVRHWKLDAPESLSDLIARVNAIRRENPAFRHDRRLRFLTVDDEQLLAYAKSTPDLSNVIVVVVNLDPHHPHAGHVELPLSELGIDPGQPYQVDDLLGGARYLWHGARNYVALDPRALPAHVFRVRRRLRTERDFDYYL